MRKFLILVTLFWSIRSENSPNYELDPDEYDFDGDPIVDDFFVQKDCDYDCVFNGLFLTSARLKKFPTSCSRVCSYIGITEASDATEEELTTAFANMKTLIGALMVAWTNHTSLKFLAGLETIETESTGISIALNPRMTELGLLNLTSITAPQIHILKNENMTRLNIPKLKNFAPYLAVGREMTININPQSPSFCVTTDEMEQILNKSAPGNITVQGKYCDPIPGQNICTSPQNGCTKVLGNVLVGVEPEWKLEMLKSVEYIFGGLHIYEANLTSLDFLPNLKFIANLDTKKPGLYVNGNTELKNTTFPSLKKILSASPFTTIIANCSEELLTNPTMCIGLTKLEATPSNWGPMIDGQTCEQIKETARNLTGWVEDLGSSGRIGWIGSLQLMIVALFLLLMVDHF
ncbi:hypothetical protein CAEBREN_16191 [Caenorhabditis brenneri]|uniref:Receptor L-domain domain-containing protein n=1 Tax=Caenorhabditis brenneri TaxID=135651 RepID=G0MUG1_CAEBE|nr:hypothetical protein CAEBREN_16191 [Caenorhabditis brenneri]